MLGAMSDAIGEPGVLLVNLGTPEAPTPAEVRRYLREFLSDPRVLDIPAAARRLLLEAVILPFRPRRSAEAYAKVWGPEGSPLLVHGRSLRDAVARTLGPNHPVELAMRYGNPSISGAIGRLVAAGVSKIVALPLFPQYASSSGGSAAAQVMREAARLWNVPPIEVLGEFPEDPGFIAAFAEVAREALHGFDADHWLLSYHGLPERHVRKSDPSGTHCLASPDCCDAPAPANRRCYRAQCFATSRALAAALGLAPGSYGVAFQSRLGRTPWIRPYTDELLNELAARGVRRLAVLCPSFVADCLETIEEIGLRAADQWCAAGGEALRLVPSLNAHPRWVDAVVAMLRPRLIA
ncbi:protoporphyrin/coproporphyrin ferrochelatase [Myxococcaceae bacterium]|jgi:ferrochelatase|nr:protoporphyrin/coproporphyrin ferrochelatase [Myxococcaceae bacterium]